MSDDAIELPVDPEDGLRSDAVAALHTFLFEPDDEDARYERLDALRTWIEWALDEEITAESVADVTVERGQDGHLRVRPSDRRRSSRYEPVVDLPATLQRSLLDVSRTLAPDTGVVVALFCIEELVADLVGVHVDEEKLFGHLVLTHGTIPAADGARPEWLEEHRAAHRRDGGYAGHRALANVHDQ